MLHKSFKCYTTLPLLKIVVLKVNCFCKKALAMTGRYVRGSVPTEEAAKFGSRPGWRYDGRGLEVLASQPPI